MRLTRYPVTTIMRYESITTYPDTPDSISSGLSNPKKEGGQSVEYHSDTWSRAKQGTWLAVLHKITLSHNYLPADTYLPADISLFKC